VQVWRRADPGFAAELAAARRRGVWVRTRRFDAAVASAFLARRAAGETVRSLLGKPGMPSQRAYRHWRLTEPSFQAALWRLRGARYAVRSSTGHGRWRAWDPALADRITLRVLKGAILRRLLAADPSLPSLAVVARWRREVPAWDETLRTAMRVGRDARGRRVGRPGGVGPGGAVYGGGGRCAPGVADAVISRVLAGASLRAVAREPGMPCARTLYRWMARRPEFAEAVWAAQDLCGG